jgi:hypothetical protein
VPRRHRLNLQVDSDLSPVNRAVSEPPPLPREALDRRLALVKRQRLVALVKHHLVDSDRQPLVDSVKRHLVSVKRLRAGSANPRQADLANRRLADSANPRLEVSANPPPAALVRRAVSAHSRRRRQDSTQTTPHSHKCVDNSAKILFRLSINSLIHSLIIAGRRRLFYGAMHPIQTQPAPRHNETHASP